MTKFLENLKIEILKHQFIPFKYNNQININLNKGKDYFNKYINILQLLLYILILLIILKLENLYITLEYYKIYDFVIVQTYINKLNILSMFSYNNLVFNTFKTYKSKSSKKYRSISNVNITEQIKKNESKNSILSIGKWNDYYYNINGPLLSNIHITQALNIFYNEIISNYEQGRVFLIQFKIKVNEKTIRSISFIQTVKISEFNEIEEIFKEFWILKGEEYNFEYEEIDSIIFTYKILPEEVKINKSQFFKSPKTNTENKGVKSIKLNGFNLPNTMDITLWGKYEFMNDNKNAVVYKSNSKAIYYVTINDYSLDVEFKINNKTLFTFKDTMMDKDNLLTFSRKLKSHTYIYINGEMVFKEVERKCKYLSNIKKDIMSSNKFLTMDLETRNLNGLLTPICVSIYDGKTKSSFFISDYLNKDEMLQTAIESIMIPQYKGYNVYLHNFSYFDGVFLIKILSTLKVQINPIIRDGRIIDVRLKYNNNKCSLYFRDSYLLLPASLDKLSKAFKVENKGLFPHKFLDQNELNYIGAVPERKYFKDISIETYNQYVKSLKNKNEWNLRLELIKYCELDVVILYKVIEIVSTEIFKLFRLNIHKYPTISSLAFGIFRSNFMPNSVKIPLIYNQMFKDIKNSYTGGSVDVFKPYGENIYSYDVNSLYPYMMKVFKMPIGMVKYFIGDISLLYKNMPYGIFEVEVIAPKDIVNPILQVKIKTPRGGVRTISPIGNWTGWYHSEEIQNAKKYGYKFKIIRGYTFESDYIFTDYVTTLYKLKMDSSKDNPIYTIAKLLLNSLYGRFGMNPEIEQHLIIDSKDSNEFFLNNKVIDIIDFKNGKELVTFISNKEIEPILNISIAIATSVTALGRVFMSQFKNRNDFSLLYTDTDSLFIDTPLDFKKIGEDIGKFKLEHIFDQAIFLAPKLYAGKTYNNEFVKAKGVKKGITFKNLEKLLMKDTSLKIKQEKWIRNFSSGTITIKDELYSIMITENKRIPVFNENGIYVDTLPLTLKDGNLKL